MKCPFCKSQRILPIEGEIKEHLIVIKTGSTIHVHGPLEKEDIMDELLTAILNERIKKRNAKFAIQTD